MNNHHRKYASPWTTCLFLSRNTLNSLSPEDVWEALVETGEGTFIERAYENVHRLASNLRSTPECVSDECRAGFNVRENFPSRSKLCFNGNSTNLYPFDIGIMCSMRNNAWSMKNEELPNKISDYFTRTPRTFVRGGESSIDNQKQFQMKTQVKGISPNFWTRNYFWNHRFRKTLSLCKLFNF